MSAVTRTPLAACALSGGLAALLALLVSLPDLIQMMSIGTLLAYTLVSACVLLLRYQPDQDAEAPAAAGEVGARPPWLAELRLRLGLPGPAERPTAASGRLVARCTLLLFLVSFLLWSTVIFGVEQGTGAPALFSGLAAALMLASVAKLLLTILQQPESGRRLAYMAPCVPFGPAAAMLVNSYLMLKLSPLTWARFAVWCVLGERFHGDSDVWCQLA